MKFMSAPGEYGFVSSAVTAFVRIDVTALAAACENVEYDAGPIASLTSVRLVSCACESCIDAAGFAAVVVVLLLDAVGVLAVEVVVAGVAGAAFAALIAAVIARLLGVFTNRFGCELSAEISIRIAIDGPQLGFSCPVESHTCARCRHARSRTLGKGARRTDTLL
jgi:hypothetical protein